MNKIWTLLILASGLMLIFTRPQDMLNTMLSSSMQVIELCLEFCAIYAVWMGLLEILDASGLGEKLSKLLSPVVKKLFKTQNPLAIKQISISLSANMLGLANASTPSAIMAMELLDDKSGKINFPMTMFTVISSCSIQLMPLTIISLRQNAGSINPSDIIFPTLLATAITTTFAILLTILISKLKGKKHE